MLRPGGLFVFIEPDSAGDMVDKILNVFPEKIVGDISAGAKAVTKFDNIVRIHISYAKTYTICVF